MNVISLTVARLGGNYLIDDVLKLSLSILEQCKQVSWQDFVLIPITFDLVYSGHHSLPPCLSAIPLSDLPSSELISFLPASLSDEI